MTNEEINALFPEGQNVNVGIAAKSKAGVKVGKKHFNTAIKSIESILMLLQMQDKMLNTTLTQDEIAAADAEINKY